MQIMDIELLNNLRKRYREKRLSCKKKLPIGLGLILLLEKDEKEAYKKEIEWLLSQLMKIEKMEFNKSKISNQKINFKPRYISKQKTYILKDENTGYYKIGKSVDPKKRERTLQSEKPTIKLLKIFDKDVEKELHRKYKKFRVRGEWFKLSKIQVKYVCTHF